MAVAEQPGSAGPPDHDEGAGLWLDDPAVETAVGSSGGRSPARRALALVALVAVLALVAVPVGLALAAGRGKSVDRRALPPTTTSATTPVSLGDGPAESQVLSALSATTASGSFDVSYTLKGQPGQSTTTSTQCVTVYDNGQGVPYGVLSKGATTGPAVTVPPTRSSGGDQSTQRCFAVPNPQATTVTGSGTIDVSPKAMVVSAAVNGSLDVSVRLNDEDVWESGGADYGLSPNPGPSGSVTGAGGQPLSGFASLVESTLGSRAGAVAMIGMASPAGYLDLEQESVTGAAEIGPGTVAGTPVTFYQVAVDPARLETMAGISADEVTTLKAAVGVLQGEGYTGTLVKVGIDGAGFIRQATSVANFSDGGTVTLDATFTKFGCAGTVLMPGQAATPTAITPCASDVATTTLAPTTTVGADLSTTSTSTPMSTTTSTTTDTGSTVTTDPGPSTTVTGKGG